MFRVHARLLAASLLLFAWAAAAPADDETPYDKAIHTYGCADYPKAYKEFMPLAQSGMAIAQYQIGMMTEQGQGTAPDLKAAYDWYLKAAQQGMADAYFALGQIYSKGEVVAKDSVQAYAWFDLAVRGGQKVAGDWLRLEGEKMTPAMIAQAQLLADSWKRQASR